VRGLGKVLPEQTTTTTVTTTITTSTSVAVCDPYSCLYYVFVPHVMYWYPNDTGMAPISLAITLAQPSSVSNNYYNAHVRIRISVTSDQVKQFSINGLMIAGNAFDAAVDDAEAGGPVPGYQPAFPAVGDHVHIYD